MEMDKAQFAEKLKALLEMGKKKKKCSGIPGDQ